MSQIEDQQSHVRRVETVAKLKRLNELEAVLPIYRQALEHIADAGGSGPWGRLAARALRDALFRDGEG